MKRIEDERIRFYLKHRQQIEEWAKVRKVLPEFAHEFYASLLEHLCGEFNKCGVEVSLHETVIRLRRRNWPPAEKGPAVELGWDNVDFSNQGGVWVGIYVHQGSDSPYWQGLFDARGRPATEDYRNQTTYGYPMYKYLPPPQGNLGEGNNLEKHGHEVIETVIKAWCDLAPIVDETV